jgi:outer membrane protein TolC
LLGLPVVAFAQNPSQAPAAASSPAKTPESSSNIEELATDALKGFEEYWSEEEAPPPNALALDVHKCVDTALAQNAQVRVAQDEVDAAKARIGQAEAQRRPQVKAQESYTYVQGLKSISIGGLFGGLQGEKGRRQDDVRAVQVLYAGGQIHAAIKASEYLAQSQEWRKQATLNGLEFDAKKAYYDCLLARAIVRVAQESVVTFQRHKADAQQMLDVGLVSNFELLRAKTELGAREADTVAAKNAVRLAIENLRRILALPEDIPVQLAGKMEWTPVTDPLGELLTQAYAKRPELLALEKAIAAADQNVRRTKGEYLPRVAATVDWSNMSGGGSMAPDGWTFAIGAEWELYAGGRRKHDVLESKAQKSGLEHQLEDVRRLIELDVRAAYIQMEDAVARIRQEKGTVELGREGLRLSQLRFQEGVGTQVETLDAQLALTNAETMLVKAVHDYAVAHAAIERAVARSWVKPNDEH